MYFFHDICTYVFTHKQMILFTVYMLSVKKVQEKCNFTSENLDFFFFFKHIPYTFCLSHFTYKNEKKVKFHRKYHQFLMQNYTYFTQNLSLMTCFTKSIILHQELAKFSSVFVDFFFCTWLKVKLHKKEAFDH